LPNPAANNPAAELATAPDQKALVLRLEQAAQSRDPLADALQQELARESREAYLKDWRAFARWLKAVAGDPEVAPDLSTPVGVLQAMKVWLDLGDRSARSLVQRWMADQTRQGLAAATIGRRLAALRFLARQASLRGVAEIRLHLLKAPRPEKRRDMRGPSGPTAMKDLVARLEERGRCPAARARNRAVALLLLTNALRRGEIGRLALADWQPEQPLVLAIRGKGRKERELVTITAATAEAIRAWLELRPGWLSSEPWAPLFCALDRGAATRAIRDLPAALEQARRNLQTMAGPGGQPPLEGSPIWWEEMTLASRCVAFSGKAVYQLVAALGAAEGRDLSPQRLRHGAVTTLVADLRLPMEQAQALARHKSVATTCGYFDRAGELQAKATASLGSLVTA